MGYWYICRYYRVGKDVESIGGKINWVLKVYRICFWYCGYYRCLGVNWMGFG